MRLSDFEYYLPTDLIAQTPSARRDGSRLMVVDRCSRTIRHHYFRELPGILTPKDLLVLNDTRVFPARLIGSVGDRKIEVLLVRSLGSRIWEVLLKPARKARPGQTIRFDKHLSALVLSSTESPVRIMEFCPTDDLDDKIDALGSVPLPPYIRRPNGEKVSQDIKRYQTVFGREKGSVAGPTAGFHFTEELLEKLNHVFLTLHIGYGTFQPIREEQLEKHRMESEFYRLSPSTAEAIKMHQGNGGSIIAVGSTCTRVLEHVHLTYGDLYKDTGCTELFIYPGFSFGIVDSLITNFHLPRSTLFVLVCAFAGRELMQEAYRIAVRENYRFYSYGDAMLIK
jgi:S-adenosylmethionine:tRNA ribosyltransferase-isomerase